MSGPIGYPSGEPPGPLKTLLRWLVSAGVAAVVTLGVFIMMTRMIDSTWVIEHLMWVFPLSTQRVGPDDKCALPGATARPAVSIAGEVGYYGDAGFVPLPGAEILGDDGSRPPHPVEVEADGAFRFVTAFPEANPSPCRDKSLKPPAETQWLTIRAPGCDERRVPVTRAWVEHRVLLPCKGRS